jgi:hypothetical protein
LELSLTDDETAALLKELGEIIDGDRYLMSQRHKDHEGDSRQD